MSYGPVLAVRGLSKTFAGSGWTRPSDGTEALAGVDLEIQPGETLGLVGESGSGKTTLGRCVLRLTEPTRGEIELMGTDFLALRGRRLRTWRRRIGAVFQDPYASLNPRMQVRQIIAEPLAAGVSASGAEIALRVSELLERVGLDLRLASSYPHELSGGQRQRVAIARALATDPELLVADEPVSALDVSVQAQIVNLLLDLKREHDLAMLFISHDMAVVERIADRIAVMYAGRIVEQAPAPELVSHPRHPYTEALLTAVPSAGRAARQERLKLREHGAEPITGLRGCPLAPRCPLVQDVCRTQPPALVEYAPRHRAACHVAGERGD